VATAGNVVELFRRVNVIINFLAHGERDDLVCISMKNKGRRFKVFNELQRVELVFH